MVVGVVEWPDTEPGNLPGLHLREEAVVMDGVELNKNRPMFGVQEQYLLAVGLKIEINSIRFIYFDNGIRGSKV